jgi:hypothetical protein
LPRLSSTALDIPAACGNILHKDRGGIAKGEENITRHSSCSGTAGDSV